MNDRTTVGSALAVIAALLVGSACGIAIEHDASPFVLDTAPSITCELHEGRTTICPGPAPTFGDLLALRAAQKDHCFFLAPKWLGGGLRQVPSGTCHDWMETGFIVENGESK